MKAETKVRGLKIYISEKTLTIIDSYKITNVDKMNEILDEIQKKENYFLYENKRTRQSLIKEWVAHNRLYKWHLFRKHTCDCDFESELSLKMRFIYFILGGFIWKKKKKKQKLN